MKILIIDNYDSFVYNLVRYIEECNVVSETLVVRNDVVTDSEIENANAILLSPGPGIPTEAGRLMEIIKKYAPTKKMLGVCLGHQAIGEVYGATLEKAPKIYHGKSSEINIDSSDYLFKGIASKTQIGRYHSWQINANLPSSLEQIAFDDNNQNMAIRHKEFDLRGVQFHPESILTPEGKKMIVNWINA